MSSRASHMRLKVRIGTLLSGIPGSVVSPDSATPSSAPVRSSIALSSPESTASPSSFGEIVKPFVGDR